MMALFIISVNVKTSQFAALINYGKMNNAAVLSTKMKVVPFTDDLFVARKEAFFSLI